MLNKLHISLFTIAILSVVYCSTPNPNENSKGQDVLKTHETIVTQENSDSIHYVYVPIYSDIYVNKINQKSLLAATLSIRNTSKESSMYVTVIDYYDTNGKKVNSFIENTIEVKAMSTVNYVIDRDDDTGGHGANFVVEYFSKNDAVIPIIQSIMIGENGDSGFSFVTDGQMIY